MARSADKKLKTKDGEGKTYLSQVKATDKWLEENPRKMIGFRVTPDAKKRIDDYIAIKAQEEHKRIEQLSQEDREQFRRKYSTDKGRPSVNALLKYLLEEEMQTSLDD